jgi:hypothetical protein
MLTATASSNGGTMKPNSLYSRIQAKLRQKINSAIELADKFNSSSKYVHMNDIMDALQSINIFLEDSEVEYIKKHFANHRGELNFKDVITACNLGIPKEHTEPDLFIDKLPQPYRLVSQIFEV